MKLKAGILALAVGLVVSATPAAASSAVYTDLASFDAAVTNQTNYSFPEFAGSGGGISIAGSSFNKGPVTFGSANGGLFMFDDAYGQPYLGDDGGGDFTISTNATALGLNLGDFFGDQTVLYFFGSITGTLLIPAANDTTFFGLTTDGGPISVTFSNTGEIDVPSFITGDASAVPELGTWIMMMVGFGAMGVTLRSRKLAARVRLA